MYFPYTLDYLIAACKAQRDSGLYETSCPIGNNRIGLVFRASFYAATQHEYDESPMPQRRELKFSVVRPCQSRDQTHEAAPMLTDIDRRPFNPMPSTARHPRLGESGRLRSLPCRSRHKILSFRWGEQGRAYAKLVRRA